MKLHFDESQNIEYKESWNDKYLEWICGFANASSVATDEFVELSSCRISWHQSHNFSQGVLQHLQQTCFLYLQKKKAVIILLIKKLYLIFAVDFLIH